MLPLFIYLLYRSVDQVRLRILFGKTDAFGAEGRLIEVVIGCEDDIVRTIIPSADGTFGYFIEYDTIEGIAQFWGVPWDEENLNAFAASCPDQLYENQQDALDYVVQLLWEAISNPQ